MFKNVFHKEKNNPRRQSEVPPFSVTEKIKLEPCTGIDDFTVDRILGTGSFGRVVFAKHKATKTNCAIKILSKALVIKTKQVLHIKAEKDILKAVNFPFVVNLLGTFQDKDCVYLVMEYIVGGEFFTHLRMSGRLKESAAKIYAAEVLLVFEYLHSRDIIYRDLKPENLLLDRDGHIKVTDFGFAKQIEHRTYTLCGTPDYLAPEVILNKGHGKPVDWWALGVLIYEMLAGYPLFYDDDPMGTYQKILHSKPEFPSHFTRSSRDLIKKLLQPDLTKRFGNLKGAARDIKMHPWFNGIDWTQLVNKTITAPIKPQVAGPDDTSQFDNYDDIPPMEHTDNLSEEEQSLFKGF